MSFLTYTYMCKHMINTKYIHALQEQKKKNIIKKKYKINKQN